MCSMTMAPCPRRPVLIRSKKVRTRILETVLNMLHQVHVSDTNLDKRSNFNKNYYGGKHFEAKFNRNRINLTLNFQNSNFTEPRGLDSFSTLAISTSDFLLVGSLWMHCLSRFHTAIIRSMRSAHCLPTMGLHPLLLHHHTTSHSQCYHLLDSIRHVGFRCHSSSFGQAV